MLTSLEPDHLVLAVQSPGLVTIKVRYTAFWSVAAGAACVGPAPGGWTNVDASQAGLVELSASLHRNSATTCAAS